MEILRYTAFSSNPNGGNPAGVVLDAHGIDDATMLATAAEVGYSETAFLIPGADGHHGIRYFSPLVEIPFCGHATIATAIAFADRFGVGELQLETKAGPVTVATAIDTDGTTTATLQAVSPRTQELHPSDLAELLAALRWRSEDLDTNLPPRVAYAGAWHPIIAAFSRERLADLDYDFVALGDLMREHDWATIDLVWKESLTVYHARNPFPPGGVVEDPATGAAAAAFGGYLRELALIQTPATVIVHQGKDMGRPGTITLNVPAELDSGIRVTGTAVQL